MNFNGRKNHRGEIYCWMTTFDVVRVVLCIVLSNQDLSWDEGLPTGLTFNFLTYTDAYQSLHVF